MEVLTYVGVLLASSFGPEVSARSTHFLVTAPNTIVAREVAAAAETQRKLLALRWLGQEAPATALPCLIRVELSEEGPNGNTTFRFGEGKLLLHQMQLTGPLDKLLISALPHEITHVLLAQHFGRPIPRWADEGAATLAEDRASLDIFERLLWRVRKQQQLMPLRRLFAIDEYPAAEQMSVFFAQSYGLVRYLVHQRGPRTFLVFVQQGLERDWDQAAQRVYGVKNLDVLEQAWLAWLQQQPNPILLREPSLPLVEPRPLPFLPK